MVTFYQFKHVLDSENSHFIASLNATTVHKAPLAST